LIDSWLWIEYLKDTRHADDLEERAAGDEQLLISAITIAEVQLYIRREKLAVDLDEFFSKVTIIPVSASIAMLAAGLKLKYKLGLADAIILATAREHGAILVTGDPHFKGMKDVVCLKK